MRTDLEQGMVVELCPRLSENAPGPRVCFTPRQRYLDLTVGC
jgi:hypothetical protein